MASANVVTLTKENFNAEVVNSSVPVIVDFWATWCGPCTMIAPTLEEIAREKAGQVKVGKVNVEEQPELSAQFQIRGLPTLIYFKNGQKVTEVSGARSKAAYLQPLEAM